MNQWSADFLGPGFEQCALGEGTTAAGTLVRFAGDAPSAGADRPALVYVHGWSDYYFNTELARFVTARGWRFYALDVPEHGRSLRPGGQPGFVPSAAHYLSSIDAALDAVAADGTGPIALMGHSTGGLAVALE
ncbi:alpha/beta hydrolase, partial [Sinomonas sp. G460-2]|uniref:alpha/beta hydrolase n=1 Tax=Sinomonas sp. G460-2 TaxID=3393464 RepID=UPI0039F00910